MLPPHHTQFMEWYFSHGWPAGPRSDEKVRSSWYGEMAATLHDVVRAMGPGEDMGVFKTKAMLRCFVNWLVALDADYHTANAKLNSLKPWGASWSTTTPAHKYFDKFCCAYTNNDVGRRGAMRAMRAAVKPLGDEDDDYQKFVKAAKIFRKDQRRFQIGEAVQCRDEEGEWRDGVVESVEPVKVKAAGFETAYTWDSVRYPGGAVNRCGAVKRRFQVGETVQCRDDGEDNWRDGVVESSVEPVKVKIVGWETAHTWDRVRHA